TGSWTLSGGSIKNGTITSADGKSVLVAAYVYGNVLDGVTLNADLTVHSSYYGLTIRHGLTLNGTLTLLKDGNHASHGALAGTQVVDGTATVYFTQTYSYGISSTLRATNQGTLTLGAGLTVHGGGLATVGDQTLPLVNQAAIISDTSGQTLAVT